MGSMPSSARGRPRSAFTVLELMVVIVIIGVMAAAVIPALGEVRSDGRQSDAAHDIVRLGRRARALTMETGVAHLLRFQRGNNARGSFGLGRIELFAGMTNRCRQTPWQQAFDAPADQVLGVDVTLREGADVLDMLSFNPTDQTTVPTAADAGRQIIRLTARGGDQIADRPALQICYQPNGQTYELFSADTTGGVALTPQLRPITFTVTRTWNGGNKGVAREVVFPVGGNARVRY